MWVKTQKPIAYTRWSPNEPSHSQSPGDQESCLAFDVGRHFQWMIDVVKIEIIFYARAREYENQFYSEHIPSMKNQIFVQKEDM